MKKNHCGLLLILVSFILSNSYAQDIPEMAWQKSNGGSGNDIPYGVITLKDGSSVVVGETSSQDGYFNSANIGSSDAFIFKSDSVGNRIWVTKVGGERSDRFNAVIATPDGGYLATGVTYSDSIEHIKNNGAPGTTDGIAVKFDSNGNQQWIRTVGGNSDDQLYGSLFLAEDSAYYITGFTYSSSGIFSANAGSCDGMIVKLSLSGNVLQTELFGGINEDGLYDIKEASHGFLVAAGGTQSFSNNHGGEDFYVIEIDTSLTLQWQNLYGGSGDERAMQLCKTAGGGFGIAGHTTTQNDCEVNGNSGGDDGWVIKIDSTGALQNQICLGGSGYDEATGITYVPSDSGFLISGYGDSGDGIMTANHSAGDLDGLLVKLNHSLNIEWAKVLGGSLNDALYCSALAPNGRYLLAGSNQSSDGDCTENSGQSDVWLIQLGDLTKNIATGLHPLQPANVVIYPNPSSSYVTVESQSILSSIALYDELGRIVMTKNNTTSKTTIDVSGFSPGIYNCVVDNTMINRFAIVH